MSVAVVTVQFVAEKSCFVALPQTVSKLASKEKEVKKVILESDINQTCQALLVFACGLQTAFGFLWS